MNTSEAPVFSANEMDDGYRRQARPKSFVFPQVPFPNSIFVCVNKEMAKEVIALIRDTCCDEQGNLIEDGSNEELMSLADKLQNNIDFGEFHRERRRRMAMGT